MVKRGRGRVIPHKIKPRFVIQIYNIHALPPLFFFNQRLLLRAAEHWRAAFGGATSEV
jgi:hypothetical protein